jgi:hypothetical protein
MNLKLVPDRELISELQSRGIACVISMVKQDETTGTNEALFGTFHRGPLKTCLGLAAALLARLQIEAIKSGMSEREFSDIQTEAHAMMLNTPHWTK